MPILSARPITVLYTASLSGKLELLPTLFTRIQAEKANASGPTLLVDLGRSCTPDVWICSATRGIGMLVAMDAMGYDAFHIGPADPLYTQPGPVQHLRGTILTPLAAGPWTASMQRGDIHFAFATDSNTPGGVSDLVVTLALTDSERVKTGWRDAPTPCRTLLLDPGTTEPLLGRLDMALLPDPPYSRVLSQQEIYLPQDIEGLSPNPSIMSVIEFVQSEARYTERKRTTP